ncbi:MAG: OmpH family outer membrane protein [Sandaracinus sp.]|nr:OmpH family outer membrane protein [Myxococcales bacterium]MCB9619044.1 OmpH family outer membrane protein [Sandaracinus sp.]MCB9633048.1 OmpH family outer membrane protein [Sandaracinus sp.]
MSLKRHAITLLFALFVSSIAPDLYAQTKIAVVDLQRALNETNEGRAAKNRLKRLFERRQRSLDEAQEKLKKMKEDIEKQQKVLSREALEQRMEEYQKAFIELQSVYVEYQRELAEKEAQLTKVILERMTEILRRMGQSEGYTMIVERNEGGVVWVPSNLDLTDAVIQTYNSENRGGGDGESMRSTMSSSMSSMSSMR